MALNHLIYSLCDRSVEINETEYKSFVEFLAACFCPCREVTDVNYFF